MRILSSPETLDVPPSNAERAMVIRGLKLSAFGRFEEIDLTDFGDGANVVFGENEAGKSTLYQFIYTMLFGIYPTKPEQHPYYPLDGRHLVGEMTYHGASGSVVTVERKLMSSPTGTLAVDGSQKKLGQGTIPEADFLSKEVYASIYALDLDDLVAPADTPAWASVQDRLLGSMNLDFLRPARQVAKMLDDEASTFWRETNQGNHRSKALEQKLSELRSLENEARARSERIRAANDELTALREHVSKQTDDRRQIERRLARLRTVVPLRRLLIRLNDLENVARGIDEYDYVPNDPLEVITKARKRIGDATSRAERLVVQIESCRERIALPTENDHAVLLSQAEIRACEARRGELRALRASESEARLRVEQDERHLQETTQRILTSDWTPDVATVFAGLSIAELRESVRQIAADRVVVADAERSLETARERHRTVGPSVLFTAAVVLTVAAVIAVVASEFVAAALLVVAAVASAVLAHRARLETGILRTLEEAVGSRRDALQESLAELRTSLHGVPLPSGRIDNGDAALVTEIEEILRHANNAEAGTARRDEIIGRIRQHEGEITALATRLGVEAHGLDATVEALLGRLDRAREVIDDAHRASAELPDLEAMLESIRAQLTADSEEAERVEAALLQIGQADVEAGADILMRGRTARSKLLDVTEEIASSTGSVEEARRIVEAALEEDADLFSDGLEGTLETDLSVLQDQRVENERALADLVHEIAQLKSQPTLADVHSDLDRANEELGEVRRTRDRLALAAAIVREADRRFRTEHQPDVIRRASEYFRPMTDGRYSGIVMEEDRLALMPSSGARLVSTEEGTAVSRGTRDQLYLSIRLALIDHLDEGRMRLPLLLDEVFVNWDARRRQEGYAVLRRIAMHRQIFLFTCHEWMRDELCDILDATLTSIES
jgi:uncharacterized protein YhaN